MIEVVESNGDDVHRSRYYDCEWSAQTETTNTNSNMNTPTGKSLTDEPRKQKTFAYMLADLVTFSMSQLLQERRQLSKSLAAHRIT